MALFPGHSVAPKSRRYAAKLVCAENRRIVRSQGVAAGGDLPIEPTWAKTERVRHWLGNERKAIHLPACMVEDVGGET